MSQDDRCEPPEVGGRWPVALLTVSDEGAAGRRQDASGDWLAARLRELPGELVSRALLPDEPDQVAEWLRGTIDNLQPALIVCTGGTGLHPRDRTPEAVRSVGEYDVPGFAEAMRAAGLVQTPHAILSRQVAVVTGRTLVVALPGAIRATQESLAAVWAALPHALEMIAGLPQASTPTGHRGGSLPADLPQPN
ncbi:MAG TPA: MogA/MoaB family molybdenum cofactor biosynthesis protein [Candidatus Dormibacteraeota bacterium]|nr:MogA/MoaB family molybdenum cofactor biosynthesis protein [Candidatus Dormibacteraeota bacterium]